MGTVRVLGPYPDLLLHHRGNMEGTCGQWGGKEVTVAPESQDTLGRCWKFYQQLTLLLDVTTNILSCGNDTSPAGARRWCADTH